MQRRELISLGIAAQTPSVYCVYLHTRKARAEGASKAEVRQAVATAAHVRHWSTVLNGMGYDLDVFKEELDKISASADFVRFGHMPSRKVRVFGSASWLPFASA
jgi:AhpD family alkylhydroperoxidase